MIWKYNLYSNEENVLIAVRDLILMDILFPLEHNQYIVQMTKVIKYDNSEDEKQNFHKRQTGL